MAACSRSFSWNAASRRPREPSSGFAGWPSSLVGSGGEPGPQHHAVGQRPTRSRRRRQRRPAARRAGESAGGENVGIGLSEPSRSSCGRIRGVRRCSPGEAGTTDMPGGFGEPSARSGDRSSAVRSERRRRLLRTPAGSGRGAGRTRRASGSGASLPRPVRGLGEGWHAVQPRPPDTAGVNHLEALVRFPACRSTSNDHCAHSRRHDIAGGPGGGDRHDVPPLSVTSSSRWVNKVRNGERGRLGAG